MFTSIFLALSEPLEQFELGANTASRGVWALILTVVCALFLIMLATPAQPAESGIQAWLASVVYGFVSKLTLENLIIKKQAYFTVVFYLFLFIATSNLLGLLPYTFTLTGAFFLTLYLSLQHFIGLNLLAVQQHGWGYFNLFIPAGAPLLIAPFLVFIELVSYFARVLSLSIRLFANMMSGHALLKILTGFCWTMLTSLSILSVVSFLPWLVVAAVFCLELLIAVLQAYVFAILITIYVNDVLNFHS